MTRHLTTHLAYASIMTSSIHMQSGNNFKTATNSLIFPF